MKKFFLFTIIATISCIHSFAQTNIIISGYIVNASDKAPVPYANVILANNKCQSLKATASDNNGFFSIKQHAALAKDSLSIRIEYIGCRPVILRNLSFDSNKMNVGIIELEEDTYNLEAIVVEYTPPPFSYKMDRKSINASSFPEANLAIDLLDNIPSIWVDNEGNLTYRGEGTFLIYINGIQTSNGGERLKQLPASQIETIDIITNPSAAYSAEGNAGIIHVTLKKSRLEGYNVYTGITGNTRDAISYSFSIDKKHKSNGWYVNGRIAQDVLNKYTEKNEQSITSDNTINTVKSKADFKNKRFLTNLEAGCNFDITPKDYLDVSVYIYPTYTKQRNTSSGIYIEEEYTNGALTESTEYNFQNKYDYDFQYFGTTLNYFHAFNENKTHKLSLDLECAGYVNELKEKQTDCREYMGIVERVGYQAYETNDYEIYGKLKYERPLSETFYLETGFDYDYNHIPETGSSNGQFDANGNIKPFTDQMENQNIYFKQIIYSGYLIGKYDSEKVDISLGVRMEYTDRQMNYIDSGNRVAKEEQIERTLFHFSPVFHLTYTPREAHQLYVSFSKRIRRPEYWNLTPFTQYEDRYTYYKGNGDITPAVSYIAELGYLKKLNKNFISGELFYRHTNHQFSNYATAISKTMFLQQPQNVGNSTHVGVELMSGWDVTRFWNMNASMSIYRTWLDYEYGETQTKSKKTKTDFRLNNTLKLPVKISAKLDLYYYSPIQHIQSQQDGYFVSNISIDKRFKNDAWRAGLSWYDVFSSKKYTTRTEGANFTTREKHNEKPYVGFRIGYYFNNQK